MFSLMDRCCSGSHKLSLSQRNRQNRPTQAKRAPFDSRCQMLCIENIDYLQRKDKKRTLASSFTSQFPFVFLRILTHSINAWKFIGTASAGRISAFTHLPDRQETLKRVQAKHFPQKIFFGHLYTYIEPAIQETARLAACIAWTCSCLDLLISAPSCLASFRAFLETHCQPLVSQSTTPSHSDSESWTAPRGCGESFAPQKNSRCHSRCHSRQTLLKFRHFCIWQYHPQLSRGGAMQIPRCTHNWLQFEAVVNSSTAWRTSGTWGSQAAPASQSTLQAGSEWICTICISITY